jgi:hypothetical protein
MKIARTLRTRYILGTTLLVLSGWLIALPAQAQDNGVYNASNTVVGSPAFIDASTFCPSGGCVGGSNPTDICSVMNQALAYLSTHFPSGGVVDARGIVPTANVCMSNPYFNANSSTGISTPSTLLLPASTITITQPWILPDHTRIVGTGRQTILSVCFLAPGSCGNPFNPDSFNSIIEMGYYGNLPNSNNYAPCPNNNVCTGVSLEHLTLSSENYTVITGLNGIYNGNSQDLSYVDDVALFKIGLKGVWISAPSSTASGATNSGPYSRITFTGAACGIHGCHPVCVDLETQTRGLHGMSCIGDSSVTGQGYAGIYVNASNNSIEDVHIEGFWDGIRIGDTSSVTAVGNISIFSATGGFGGKSGPTQNTVHICGSYSQPNLGACANTPTVSDISLFQIKNTGAQNCNSTVVVDDATGTVIATSVSNYDSNSNFALPLGIYILGEETVANGTNGANQAAPGYSRFSTSPSIYSSQSPTCAGNFTTSIVPTWGVGGTNPSGGTCSTPGALYSYTSGGAMSSVFVCSGGSWKPIA